MTQSLAVSGTNLFAGTYYGGVFRTTDNGTNWTAVNTGLPDPEIFSLAASGTNLFAGTYLGVSRSTDNGTSWTPTGVHNIIYALTASGPFVFAGKHSGGVFRSTNNGTSWTSVNTGFSDTTVYSLAILSPNLVVGTYIGAFRSANNGASWTATSLTNTSVLSLAFAPNGAGGSNLFAGTYLGVFLSTDNGTSWTAAGLTNTTIPSFAVWGNNLFAGTHNDGVFLSTDNGTSWTATGLTNDGVYSLAVLDTNLFAGTGERGVWRRSLFDMPEGSIGGRVFHDLNGNGVMESGESGLTGWTLFLTGTTQETTQTDANGDYHFKSLVRGTYTVRENLPADWVQTYPSGNNGYTTPLPFSANTSGINFGNYTPHSVSVSKAWNMISLPVTVANGFKNSLFHHATSGAFAFTSFGYTAQDTLRNGVGYWLNFPENEVVAMVGNDRSTDTFIVAAGWNMVGSTTRPVAASSITSDPPGLLTSHFFGYRGGYNSSDSLMPGEGYWVKSQDAGVLILSSSVTAPANRIRIVLDPELPPPPPGEANSKKPRMPSEFFLSQNFPNPFNPSARIEYTLPRAANVSLKVFNMLGQEVSRLVYEYQDAGYKSVIFDASSLPSGVYLYRLQAGSFADVRKMLFLR